MRELKTERHNSEVIVTTIIKSFEVMLGITLLGMGSTLGIIAALGQTTAISMTSAIAGALGIKVGTAMFLEYGIFIVLQMVIYGWPIRVVCFLQLIPSLVKSAVLNYFCYSFLPFQLLNPDTYPERLLIFIVGMTCNSLGFAATKCAEFVNYPPESFCSVVAERTGIRFGTCKTYLDFAYIFLTVLICLTTGQSLGIIREGTIIFAIVNGPLINLFSPYIKKIYLKIETYLVFLLLHSSYAKRN